MCCIKLIYDVSKQTIYRDKSDIIKPNKPLKNRLQNTIIYKTFTSESLFRYNYLTDSITNKNTVTLKCAWYT